MTLEQALRDFLVGDTDITNDVGRSIYLGRRPNDSPAFCVTLQQSRSSSHEYTLDAEDSHFRPMVAVEIFGRGTLDTKIVARIAKNIRQRINTLPGLMGAITIDDFSIESDGWAEPDRPADGSDKWYFRWAIDIEFVYQPLLTET